MPTRGAYNEAGWGGDLDQYPGLWKTGIAVFTGDFVFRDVADGFDKPVSSYTWNTDIATTAGTLNAVLRGVSMVSRFTAQPSSTTEEGNIIYTGVFCHDCAALGSAAKPFDLVTFVKATGNNVENQKVAITATIGTAIGRVVKDAPVGATAIYWRMLLPGMFGGPTAAA